MRELCLGSSCAGGFIRSVDWYVFCIVLECGLNMKLLYGMTCGQEFGIWCYPHCCSP
jgi:hypothetical protein